MTIPGHGEDRINAAYTLGGPALAIKTVQALTGMEINHVVLVDFSGFRELVDALGGVTLDNPEKIISNSFDGHPWRFGRGRLHLDGRHALAYARVRENTANPADNDLTRGLRQQRVLQAIARELASPSTLLHLPSVGSALGKPLATDLSANDLLELGWRHMRASRTIHCRLGGTVTSIGGASELIGGDENRRVILAVLGRSAPLAAEPGDTFAAGCTYIRPGAGLELFDDELSPPELFESELLDSELFDSDFEPESAHRSSSSRSSSTSELSFEPDSEDEPESARSPLALLPPRP